MKQILDTDFSLLAKFKEAAPGSFRHCQNVMNLSETIALEMGLDQEIMKIAGLYHDIGKMNAPQWFSENQDDSNPHDRIEPSISYHIITKHIGDSIIYLLQIPEIPQKVISIVAQHHGDTVLKSIFKKAETDVEDRFRYKCKKPDCLEAAVLMMVDSVEAAARSMYNAGKLNGPETRKKLVSDITDKLMDDDQLDDIRVGEIKQVRKILARELDSIYHKRIEYDTDDDDNKKLGEIKKSGIS